MKKIFANTLKVFLLVFLIFLSGIIKAQTKAETKSFIENISFHNPSKFQNLYFSFFFKSDKLGYSVVKRCPPKYINSNAEDFMLITVFNVEEDKYHSLYLRISDLRGYKLKYYDNVYYIELQTKAIGNAFIYFACDKDGLSNSLTTLSTSSYDDAMKFLKALKHLCDLYETSFIDFDNLFK